MLSMAIIPNKIDQILKPKLLKELDEKYSDQKNQQRLQSNSTDGSFVFMKKNNLLISHQSKDKYLQKKQFFQITFQLKQKKLSDSQFNVLCLSYNISFLLQILTNCFPNLNLNNQKTIRKWNSLKFKITIGQRG
ncbi:unnamed protein product [Paramecium pentaurelia]|uniref:Uncharacterized protein n=1 Tax=Paramecium pentaurelia TaxID=43138 RepID=A0A8S1VXZ9_9CILI|nr:unnamed protein product [Paramecium pentaurelia]